MTDLAANFPYRLPYPSTANLRQHLEPLLTDWYEMVEQEHLAREYDSDTPPELWAYLALTKLQSCTHIGPDSRCSTGELMTRVLRALLDGVTAEADLLQLKSRERHTDT
jgi:hypothetical protein